ncbi:hypothetical protein CHS0354_028509 [Potamilus streckersoni]|uniref:Uncharacterized protein n=1 Tax=Potamilus streckersoni TaxID=2493646 RepID=A0AAE0T2G2_9BIVA|nr:hypothetical protein CHS0354_028509 [Potamilus streckersoni]
MPVLQSYQGMRSPVWRTADRYQSNSLKRRTRTYNQEKKICGRYISSGTRMKAKTVTTYDQIIHTISIVTGQQAILVVTIQRNSLKKNRKHIHGDYHRSPQGKG